MVNNVSAKDGIEKVSWFWDVKDRREHVFFIVAQYFFEMSRAFCEISRQQIYEKWRAILMCAPGRSPLPAIRSLPDIPEKKFTVRWSTRS
jgi:hypothetical protein